MLALDHLEDIIGAGIILLVALGMILLFALRRKIRAGKGGLFIGEDGRKEKLPAVAAVITPCVPFVEEHTAILKRLEGQITAINRMQIVVVQSLDMLLGKAEGADINGGIRDVRLAIARGEGFKEALGVENEAVK